MKIKALREGIPNYYRTTSIYFTLFFIISLIVLFCQNFLPGSDFLGSMFIPDVSNMSDTFDNLHGPDAPALFTTGLAGMYYLYFIPWLLHPSICIILNLIFVYYSFLLISDIFVLTRIAGSRVCMILLLNPYLYLAVTGPNKEIPLIWATLYIVRGLLLKPRFWLFKIIVLSILVVFIRDGYGLILLLAILIFSNRLPAKLTWKIGLAVSFVAAIAFEAVYASIAIFARNADVGETIGPQKSALIGDFLNSSNPFFSVIKQITRMIYNGLTLSIFPVLSTEGGSIYVIGWAYWLFGILMAMALAGCIYTLFVKVNDSETGKQRLKIAGLVIFLWSTISISLYIQPRYLMTVLPLAFGVLASLDKVKRMVFSILIISFSFFVIILYACLGFPIAKASSEGLVPNTASFLINPAEK